MDKAYRVKRGALFGLLFFVCSGLGISCSVRGPKEITGLWKSRDQNSDTPRSIVAIYKYKDKYYGRMLATYGEDGKIKDTIYTMTDKAPGIQGNPPYCGLDFMYDLEEAGKKNTYKGKIVDPEKGKVYTAEVWRRGDKLMVRGEVWVFGKTIPWPQASASDLPPDFKMPDIKAFVPVIPKTT